MMRSAGGVLAVAAIALFVCCSADPRQEQELAASDHSSVEHYDPGHKAGILDPMNGNLVREVRDLRRSSYVPYLISRRFDLASPYGGKHEPWALAPVEYVRYYGDGLPKRNFDEIDRSGLDTFVKRNFDEIDLSSMPFPYTTKRFNSLSRGANKNRDSTNPSYFQKRQNPSEHPMDEIDLSLLPIGSRRSMGQYPMVQHVLL